ncbi:MAG: hypothetical protein AAF629_33320 [Chloroflexota bacterium]
MSVVHVYVCSANPVTVTINEATTPLIENGKSEDSGAPHYVGGYSRIIGDSVSQARTFGDMVEVKINDLTTEGVVPGMHDYEVDLYLYIFANGCILTDDNGQAEPTNVAFDCE